MPITAWQCPCCGFKSHLNHYADSRCGDLIHPDFATAILAHEAAEDGNNAGVRVSHGLGCPRKTRLMEQVEFAANPLDYNAQLTGTAWHKLMGEAAGLTGEIEVRGTIAGLAITGHLDRLRTDSDGAIVIDDHKHVNDFRRKWLKGPSDEHKAQVSLYAELLNQSKNIIPTYGNIVYHFTYKAGGESPFVCFKFKLWGLDETLSFKPYNGIYTVGELLGQAAVRGRWAELPLAGESQELGSKTACDYCPVRQTCWEQARGAPW